MLTDPSTFAADREARNEYLIEIDEAWELCRDAVEGARRNYETALDSSRSRFDAERAQASTLHDEALDSAWSNYKQQVGATGPQSRHEVMADARATYDLKVAESRKGYEESVGIARDSYSRQVEEARLAYESAVDSALANHRNAVHDVERYLAPGEPVVGSPQGTGIPKEPGAAEAGEEDLSALPPPPPESALLPPPPAFAWQSGEHAPAESADQSDAAAEAAGTSVYAGLNGSPNGSEGATW